MAFQSKLIKTHVLKQHKKVKQTTNHIQTTPKTKSPTRIWKSQWIQTRPNSKNRDAQKLKSYQEHSFPEKERKIFGFSSRIQGEMYWQSIWVAKKKNSQKDCLKENSSKERVDSYQRKRIKGKWRKNVSLNCSTTEKEGDQVPMNWADLFSLLPDCTVIASPMVTPIFSPSFSTPRKLYSINGK